MNTVVKHSSISSRKCHHLGVEEATAVEIRSTEGVSHTAWNYLAGFAGFFF